MWELHLPSFCCLLILVKVVCSSSEQVTRDTALNQSVAISTDLRTIQDSVAAGLQMEGSFLSSNNSGSSNYNMEEEGNDDSYYDISLTGVSPDDQTESLQSLLLPTVEHVTKVSGPDPVIYSGLPGNNEQDLDSQANDLNLLPTAKHLIKVSGPDPVTYSDLKGNNEPDLDSQANDLNLLPTVEHLTKVSGPDPVTYSGLPENNEQDFDSQANDLNLLPTVKHVIKVSGPDPVTYSDLTGNNEPDLDSQANDLNLLPTVEHLTKVSGPDPVTYSGLLGNNEQDFDSQANDLNLLPTAKHVIRVSGPDPVTYSDLLGNNEPDLDSQANDLNLLPTVEHVTKVSGPDPVTYSDLPGNNEPDLDSQVNNLNLLPTAEHVTKVSGPDPVIYSDLPGNNEPDLDSQAKDLNLFPTAEHMTKVSGPDPVTYSDLPGNNEPDVDSQANDMNLLPTAKHVIKVSGPDPETYSDLPGNNELDLDSQAHDLNLLPTVEHMTKVSGPDPVTYSGLPRNNEPDLDNQASDLNFLPAAEHVTKVSGPDPVTYSDLPGNNEPDLDSQANDLNVLPTAEHMTKVSGPDPVTYSDLPGNIEPDLDSQANDLNFLPTGEHLTKVSGPDPVTYSDFPGNNEQDVDSQANDLNLLPTVGHVTKVSGPDSAPYSGLSGNNEPDLDSQSNDLNQSLITMREVHEHTGRPVSNIQDITSRFQYWVTSDQFQQASSQVKPTLVQEPFKNAVSGNSSLENTIRFEQAYLTEEHKVIVSADLSTNPVVQTSEEKLPIVTSDDIVSNVSPYRTPTMSWENLPTSNINPNTEFAHTLPYRTPTMSWENPQTVNPEVTSEEYSRFKNPLIISDQALLGGPQEDYHKNDFTLIVSDTVLPPSNSASLEQLLHESLESHDSSMPVNQGNNFGRYSSDDETRYLFPPSPLENNDLNAEADNEQYQADYSAPYKTQDPLTISTVLSTPTLPTAQLLQQNWLSDEAADLNSQISSNQQTPSFFNAPDRADRLQHHLQVPSDFDSQFPTYQSRPTFSEGQPTPHDPADRFQSNPPSHEPSAVSFQSHMQNNPTFDPIPSFPPSTPASSAHQPIPFDPEINFNFLSDQKTQSSFDLPTSQSPTVTFPPRRQRNQENQLEISQFDYQNQNSVAASISQTTPSVSENLSSNVNPEFDSNLQGLMLTENGVDKEENANRSGYIEAQSHNNEENKQTVPQRRENEDSANAELNSQQLNSVQITNMNGKEEHAEFSTISHPSHPDFVDAIHSQSIRNTPLETSNTYGNQQPVDEPLSSHSFPQGWATQDSQNNHQERRPHWQSSPGHLRRPVPSPLYSPANNIGQFETYRLKEETSVNHNKKYKDNSKTLEKLLPLFYQIYNVMAGSMPAAPTSHMIFSEQNRNKLKNISEIRAYNKLRPFNKIMSMMKPVLRESDGKAEVSPWTGSIKLGQAVQLPSYFYFPFPETLHYLPNIYWNPKLSQREIHKYYPRNWFNTVQPQTANSIFSTGKDKSNRESKFSDRPLERAPLPVSDNVVRKTSDSNVIAQPSQSNDALEGSPNVNSSDLDIRVSQNSPVPQRSPYLPISILETKLHKHNSRQVQEQLSSHKGVFRSPYPHLKHGHTASPPSKFKSSSEMTFLPSTNQVGLRTVTPNFLSFVDLLRPVHVPPQIMIPQSGFTNYARSYLPTYGQIPAQANKYASAGNRENMASLKAARNWDYYDVIPDTKQLSTMQYMEGSPTLMTLSGEMQQTNDIPTDLKGTDYVKEEANLSGRQLFPYEPENGVDRNEEVTTHTQKLNLSFKKRHIFPHESKTNFNRGDEKSTNMPNDDKESSTQELLAYDPEEKISEIDEESKQEQNKDKELRLRDLLPYEPENILNDEESAEKQNGDSLTRPRQLTSDEPEKFNQAESAVAQHEDQESSTSQLFPYEPGNDEESTSSHTESEESSQHVLFPYEPEVNSERQLFPYEPENSERQLFPYEPENSERQRFAYEPENSERQLFPYEPEISERQLFPYEPENSERQRFAYEPENRERQLFPYEPEISERQLFPYEPENSERQRFAYEPENRERQLFPYEPEISERQLFAYEPENRERQLFAYEPENSERQLFPYEPANSERQLFAYEPEISERQLFPYEPEISERQLFAYEPENRERQLFAYEPENSERQLFPYEPENSERQLFPFEPEIKQKSQDKKRTTHVTLPDSNDKQRGLFSYDETFPYEARNPMNGEDKAPSPYSALRQLSPDPVTGALVLNAVSSSGHKPKDEFGLPAFGQPASAFLKRPFDIRGSYPFYPIPLVKSLPVDGYFGEGSLSENSQSKIIQFTPWQPPVQMMISNDPTSLMLGHIFDPSQGIGPDQLRAPLPGDTTDNGDFHNDHTEKQDVVNESFQLKDPDLDGDAFDQPGDAEAIPHSENVARKPEGESPRRPVEEHDSERMGSGKESQGNDSSLDKQPEKQQNSGKLGKLKSAVIKKDNTLQVLPWGFMRPRTEPQYESYPLRSNAVWADPGLQLQNTPWQQVQTSVVDDLNLPPPHVENLPSAEPENQVSDEASSDSQTEAVVQPHAQELVGLNNDLSLLDELPSTHTSSLKSYDDKRNANIRTLASNDSNSQNSMSASESEILSPELGNFNYSREDYASDKISDSINSQTSMMREILFNESTSTDVTSLDPKNETQPRIDIEAHEPDMSFSSSTDKQENITDKIPVTFLSSFGKSETKGQTFPLLFSEKQEIALGKSANPFSSTFETHDNLLSTANHLISNSFSTELKSDSPDKNTSNVFEGSTSTALEVISTEIAPSNVTLTPATTMFSENNSLLFTMGSTSALDRSDILSTVAGLQSPSDKAHVQSTVLSVGLPDKAHVQSTKESVRISDQADERSIVGSLGVLDKADIQSTDKANVHSAPANAQSNVGSIQVLDKVNTVSTVGRGWILDKADVQSVVGSTSVPNTTDLQLERVSILDKVDIPSTAAGSFGVIDQEDVQSTVGSVDLLNKMNVLSTDGNIGLLDKVDVQSTVESIGLLDKVDVQSNDENIGFLDIAHEQRSKRSAGKIYWYERQSSNAQSSGEGPTSEPKPGQDQAYVLTDQTHDSFDLSTTPGPTQPSYTFQRQVTPIAKTPDHGVAYVQKRLLDVPDNSQTMSDGDQSNSGMSYADRYLQMLKLKENSQHRTSDKDSSLHYPTTKESYDPKPGNVFIKQDDIDKEQAEDDAKPGNFFTKQVDIDKEHVTDDTKPGNVFIKQVDTDKEHVTDDTKPGNVFIKQDDIDKEQAEDDAKPGNFLIKQDDIDKEHVTDDTKPGNVFIKQDDIDKEQAEDDAKPGNFLIKQVDIDKEHVTDDTKPGNVFIKQDDIDKEQAEDDAKPDNFLIKQVDIDKEHVTDDTKPDNFFTKQVDTDKEHVTDDTKPGNFFTKQDDTDKEQAEDDAKPGNFLIKQVDTDKEYVTDDTKPGNFFIKQVDIDKEQAEDDAKPGNFFTKQVDTDKEHVTDNTKPGNFFTKQVDTDKEHVTDAHDTSQNNDQQSLPHPPSGSFTFSTTNKNKGRNLALQNSTKSIEQQNRPFFQEQKSATRNTTQHSSPKSEEFVLHTRKNQSASANLTYDKQREDSNELQNDGYSSINTVHKSSTQSSIPSESLNVNSHSYTQNQPSSPTKISHNDKSLKSRRQFQENHDNMFSKKLGDNFVDNPARKGDSVPRTNIDQTYNFLNAPPHTNSISNPPNSLPSKFPPLNSNPHNMRSVNSVPSNFISIKSVSNTFPPENSVSNNFPPMNSMPIYTYPNSQSNILEIMGKYGYGIQSVPTSQGYIPFFTVPPFMYVVSPNMMISPRRHEQERTRNMHTKTGPSMYMIGNNKRSFEKIQGVAPRVMYPIQSVHNRFQRSLNYQAHDKETGEHGRDKQADKKFDFIHSISPERDHKGNEHKMKDNLAVNPHRDYDSMTVGHHKFNHGQKLNDQFRKSNPIHFMRNIKHTRNNTNLKTDQMERDKPGKSPHL